MYRLQRNIIFLLCILLITSCEKDAPFFSIKNLNNNEVTVLGHAGMGTLYKYPGDTYEGIIPVLEIGANGSEIDIQMTKDSVLVLFHDAAMNLKTTCEDTVFNYNFAEIGGCTYHSVNKNIYVISVENLFNRIENIRDYQFSFDCKINGKIHDDNYMDTYIRAIDKINVQYDLTDNIILEGNSLFIEKVQYHGLKNKLFLTGEQDLQTRIEKALTLNTFGIGADNQSITKNTIDSIHDLGLWVMVWSPKTKEENIELLQKNPDIIQTYKPIHLLKVLGKYNYDYKIP